jgi:hypothetical protein
MATRTPGKLGICSSFKKPFSDAPCQSLNVKRFATVASLCGAYLQGGGAVGGGGGVAASEHAQVPVLEWRRRARSVHLDPIRRLAEQRHHYPRGGERSLRLRLRDGCSRVHARHERICRAHHRARLAHERRVAPRRRRRRSGAGRPRRGATLRPWRSRGRRGWWVRWVRRWMRRRERRGPARARAA